MQATRELMGKGVEAERAGQVEAALNLLEQAARTWPELPELLPVYNRLANRWQKLRVGVVDLPGMNPSAAPVLLAAAERRRRELTQVPLFEPARFENKLVRYESKYFSDWEPTELGHSVLFRLRPWRAAGESHPLLTAASLGDALRHRLDPHSSFCDARFSAAVESLEVRFPFDLLVRFRQVPLRPEALFAFVPPPAGAGETSSADDSGSPGNLSAPSSATFPFELSSVDERRALYRRSLAEPDAATDRHVAEVIEVRYDSHE